MNSPCLWYAVAAKANVTLCLTRLHGLSSTFHQTVCCARPARCSHAWDQPCLLLRSPAAQISGVIQSQCTVSSGEMLGLIGDLLTISATSVYSNCGIWISGLVEFESIVSYSFDIGLPHICQKLLLDLATSTANNFNHMQRAPCNWFKL